MARKNEYITKTHAPTLIIGVDAPYNKTINIDSYYQEFLNLVRTNGTEYDQAVFIKLREIDPGYFLTKGKLQEVKELVEKHNITDVIISEPLSVQQERNLNDFLRCKIHDRTRLILEIFEKSANTAEGKLQVAIAMLQFDKCDLLLVPVEGMTDYNHLSVRSAVAIILDRWLGLNIGSHALLVRRAFGASKD